MIHISLQDNISYSYIFNTKLSRYSTPPIDAPNRAHKLNLYLYSVWWNYKNIRIKKVVFYFTFHGFWLGFKDRC